MTDERNRDQGADSHGKIATSEPRAARDAIRFVISANRKRRHMTPAARAMAAARSLEMFEAAAAQRLRAAQEAGGRARHGDDSSKAKLPESRQARDDAAAAFNREAERRANARRWRCWMDAGRREGGRSVHIGQPVT